MKRRLCILQVFGPEGGNHGSTTACITRLMYAAGKMGHGCSLLYQHGGSQALARSEVLAAAFLLGDFTDYLWLDSDAWLPGSVRDVTLALEQVLAASDDAELPVSLPYVTRLSPVDNAPAWALSFFGPKPAYFTLARAGLRVARLQGSGFGFVHMRREHVAKMYAAYAASESFASERAELAGKQCVHLFHETNGAKVYDALDASRPVRALPEDDSYWHRARGIGEGALCLVDVPLVHRGAIANLPVSYADSAPPREESPPLFSLARE